MEVGDKQKVNLILRQFKDNSGCVNFPMVLKVPVSERIPELAKQDFGRINLLIIGAITVSFESLGLRKGLDADQILDLSEAIIDTSTEDNLSFEDLMLFLQKIVRGEYEIGETMNIPKFMKVFELYREERWQELNRYRNEQHAQNKVLGDTGKTTQPDELSEHFSNFGSRIAEMKDSIRSLRDENKNLKMDNL